MQEPGSQSKVAMSFPAAGTFQFFARRLRFDPCPWRSLDANSGAGFWTAIQTVTQGAIRGFARGAQGPATVPSTPISMAYQHQRIGSHAASIGRGELPGA